MIRPVEAHALIRSRKTSIVILALLTLLLAQAAAGLHALKHFGQRGDPLGLPGQHSQLCLECASFAPLTGAHGGPATVLVVTVLAGAGPLLLLYAAHAGQRLPATYQSRAPPR